MDNSDNKSKWSTCKKCCLCVSIILLSLFILLIIIFGIIIYLTPPPPPYIEHLPLGTRIRLRLFGWSNTVTGLILGEFRKSGHSPLNYTRKKIRERSAGRVPDDENVTSQDTIFDTVPVRLYIPTKRSANGPAMIFFHGGGWSVADVDVYDLSSRWFARELQMFFVSVEYRLAPEALWPAQIDDCFTALRHLMINAKKWNIDPTRIAISGDSAGGHLVTSLVFRWRRMVLRGAPADKAGLHPIKLQIPMYPVTQFMNLSTTSFLLNRHDYILPKSDQARNRARVLLGEVKANDPAVYAAFYASNMSTRASREKLARFFEFAYVNSTPDLGEPSLRTSVGGLADNVDAYVTPMDRAKAAQLRADPREHDPNGDPQMDKELLQRMMDAELSPIVADSFEQLPNAYIVTCGYDVLRDDGLLYVKRLRTSGQVPVVYHRYYPHAPHVLLLFDQSPIIQRDLAAYLKANPGLL